MSAEKVLIVHGGRFGQSEKIAKSMQQVLRDAGLETQLLPLTKDVTLDPQTYGALLLVTSVRYGYFDPNAYLLIERNRDWLESHPAQIVTVSLTARKPEKRDPHVHSYTKKFLEKSGWKGRIAVVAGALEYPRYNLLDRLAIQLIMKITNGPTDKTASIEYTDWDQVTQTAQVFAAEIIA